MSTHPDHTPEPDPDLAHPRTTQPGRGPVPPAEKSLSSRTGYAWTGLVVGVLILVVLLIFIVQNLDEVQVHLLFWDFTLPLGITVLLSVIGGALVMASVGGVRILQLRRRAKQR
ncbi:LapA family protein [Nocardia pneumoniae]|uniref:LapA family protein n=1 Tax=Nocardia pneumoniae TaxID=228601 RepID=UPI0005924FE0|nr:lipopolysaccharide assembly protein LapA domain-containing protein [Nocardia pneumoniae]